MLLILLDVTVMLLTGAGAAPQRSGGLQLGGQSVSGDTSQCLTVPIVQNFQADQVGGYTIV